jgi:RsiW-degrading membrane proteinase PrsW (M82 family)
LKQSGQSDGNVFFEQAPARREVLPAGYLVLVDGDIDFTMRSIIVTEVILISMLIALAPGLFLVWYFSYRDRYEREPKRMIVKIFLLGALMVIPAALLETLLASVLNYVTTGLFYIFILSFLVIAPIEESLKYFAVRRWIYNSLEFDEVMDGIVYTVSASLGFATLENVFYVLTLGRAIGVARAFLTVPGHALFGALLGYYLGQAKFNPDKESRLIMKGLFYAFLCHGLYDFLVLTRSAFSALVILLLVTMALWIRQQLKASELASQQRMTESKDKRLVVDNDKDHEDT